MTKYEPSVKSATRASVDFNDINDADQPTAAPAPRFQFRISHLLGITLVAAVFFAAASHLGLLGALVVADGILMIVVLLSAFFTIRGNRPAAKWALVVSGTMLAAFIYLTGVAPCCLFFWNWR